MLGIVGQTKGAAVTGRDGTWATVLLLSAESVGERVAQRINKNHRTSGTKKCISSGYMRDKARIRKTVAAKFLIWPAFSIFLVLNIYAGNQGRQQWSKFQFA